LLYLLGFMFGSYIDTELPHTQLNTGTRTYKVSETVSYDIMNKI